MQENHVDSDIMVKTGKQAVRSNWDKKNLKTRHIHACSQRFPLFIFPLKARMYFLDSLV